MDRKPVPLTQQWRHVIESRGTGDKSDRRVLNSLDAIHITVRQTDEGGITIVQSHEDETRDQHGERTVCQIATDAANLSQYAETRRRQPGHVVAHGHCRVEIETEISDAVNRLNDILTDGKPVRW